MSSCKQTIVKCFFILHVILVFLPRKIWACPEVCKCTGNIVDCSNKGLTSIPSGIIPTTVELRLNNNQILTLDSDYATPGRELVRLKILDLRHNNLTSIPDLAFESFINLEVLMLDYNNFAFEDGQVFVEPFGGLEGSLKHLSASHNLMSGEISQYTFGFHEFEYLDLSHNNFISVEDLAFAYSLRHLDISYNQITELTENTFELNFDLKFLDIRGLQSEGLQRIVFTSLSSLTHLRLGGSGLIRLSQSIFRGLDNLQTLEIVESDINSFPVSLLSHCPTIVRLSLSKNKLTSLSAPFFSFVPTLKQLDLSQNLFEDVDSLSQALRFSTIHALNLDLNRIDSSFSSLVSSQDKLENLSLADNRLISLHESLASSTLKRINFARNSISHIASEAFVNCIALESLDLTDNALASLPSFETARSLQLIIDGNKWDCSCTFYKAFRFHSTDSESNRKLKCSDETRNDDLSCISCFTPPRLLGRLASSLESTDFSSCDYVPQSRSPSTSRSTALIICIVIAAFLIIVGIAILVWLKRDYIRTLTRKSGPALDSPKAESSANVGVYESQDTLASNAYSNANDVHPTASPYCLATDIQDSNNANTLHNTIHPKTQSAPLPTTEGAYDNPRSPPLAQHYEVPIKHHSRSLPNVDMSSAEVIKKKMIPHNVLNSPDEISSSSLPAHNQNPLKQENVPSTYILPETTPAHASPLREVQGEHAYEMATDLSPS